MMKKLFKHKILSIIIVIVLAIGSYFIYQRLTAKSAIIQYQLEAVQKGTLVVSVSGTGQVSASSQVDIKPKASGDITSLPVKEGQEIKKGQLIAQLDATDALNNIRSAKSSLESAQLALKKLQKPTDQLSLTQAQNAIDQANESKATAQTSLVKAYEDGFNTITSTFLDLPEIVSGLQTILYGNTYSDKQANIYYFADQARIYSLDTNDPSSSQYAKETDSSYQTAKAKYDKNFADYKASSRYSDSATLEALLDETYDTVKSLAESVKNANNLLNYYQDKLNGQNITAPSSVTTYVTNLQSYTSKTSSDLSSLLAIQDSITTAKNTLVSSDRTIKEKTESLAELQAGTDTLDLQSQELTIQDRKNSLIEAQQTVADYSVRAPFDGVLASVAGTLGDSASSGTTIATLITKQQIAEISLNEVDVAKVKIGQKASMTFDAVEDLEMTGQVVQIDSIGTVSSGVVTYGVKIAFDAQNDLVKSGMTVTANIITDTKTDVLLVPSSVIKSQNSRSYVEMIDNPRIVSSSSDAIIVTADNGLRQQTVTIGVSNDTDTEIIDGLSEGDKIVTQTITATATAKTQTSVLSLFGLGGNRNVGARSTSSTNASKTSSGTQSAGGNAGPPPGGF